jgi:hypothetical protein
LVRPGHIVHESFEFETVDFARFVEHDAEGETAERCFVWSQVTSCGWGGFLMEDEFVNQIGHDVGVLPRPLGGRFR